MYSLALEQGQYLEIHLDSYPRSARALLFPPEVEPSAAPTAGSDRASSVSELSPATPGQVVWEVARTAGSYHLRVEAASALPANYRLTIHALRSATGRDWSRHRCAEVWGEAERTREDGELEAALEAFGESRSLCEAGEYARGIASSLTRRGRILLELGRRDEARGQLRAGLQVWKEVGEEPSVAGTLVWLARLEREVTDWERASGHLDDALEVAREYGSRTPEANALDEYCKLYRDQGRTEKALAACRESVRLWEATGRLYESVDSLINLGQVHFYRGELDEARKSYLRGLDLLAQHENREQEATLSNELARLHDAAGEYQRALEHFQEALEAYQSLGKKAFAAQVLLNMGAIHRKLEKHDAALDFLRQALDLMEEGKDALGRIRVLHGLSDVYVDQGDLSRARRTLDEALGLSRRSGSRLHLADSLGRSGALLFEVGEPEDALAALHEALELCRRSAARWKEADLLIRLAQAHARLGDTERALEVLDRAATLNEEIGKRSGLAEARYRIARLERDRGNLEGARDSIEQALVLVDNARLVIGADELRTLFSATVRPYHELYIDILMKQHRRRPDAGHDAEALRASEQARARSLLEILTEAKLEPGSEVPKALLEKRAELRSRLNTKELERRNLLLAGEVDPSSLFRVKLDLEGLLTGLREVERQIRAASPRYAALTHPLAVTRGEIQRSILDQESTLLEYSLGEEGSFLWVVTDDDFRTYELPGRDEIEEMARCLHWLITSYGEPPQEALAPQEATCLGDRFAAFEGDPRRGPFQLRAHRRGLISDAYSELAAELSRLLLAGPARDGLLGHRLAVVSDGALEYVPFAALPEPLGSGRPLVRAHELVRLPSASVLAYQRGQEEPPEEPPGVLAIVADPLYGPDDPRIERRSQSLAAAAPADEPEARRGLLISSYRRLDFAGQEAEAIARFAPAGATFIARGAEAHRETVLGGALSGYRYVHFATHGEIDTQHPELSGLVLSLVDATGTRIQDGFLRLHEIYGMELDDSDMVVLSACDTALGREIRGEGLVGLTRGFLYAGAERVVASLWQVQDLVTAELMAHFYRGLLEEGRPPADALRQAQLAILEADDGHYGFPYYWAGFVLQGEWR